MSKALATMLNEDSKTVNDVIEKLESLAGYSSEDVRLLARVNQEAASKISSLGLDPADTTGEEIFHALQVKLQSDVAHIARSLNLNGAGTLDEHNQKIVDIVNNSLGKSEVMALKGPVVKKLLRNNPPKKFMKANGFRSLESMIKRSSLAEIFAGAMALEPTSWFKSLERDITHLTSSDVEWRSPDTIALSNSRWQQNSQPVNCLTLVGAVVLWPTAHESPEQKLNSLVKLLEAHEILEADSFYLSLNKFNPSFGKIAAKLFISGVQDSLSSGFESLFDFSQLRHVFEDVQRPVEKISAIHPSLAWWKECSHLNHDGVSLNLADNLKALQEGSNYTKRSIAGCVDSLKREILKSYCAHAGVKNYFMNPFDDTLALTPVSQEVPEREFEIV
jgi:hypothetical protein